MTDNTEQFSNFRSETPKSSMDYYETSLTKPLGLVRTMTTEETSEMTKAEIVAEVDAIAWNRLFTCRRWLADREVFSAVNRKLIKMGLVECVSSNTWQATPLGRELDIDLLEAFMGLWAVWEVPLILEDHGLIDEWENDSICEHMYTKTNPEIVLLGYVRRAYFDYHKATKSLH